MRRDGLWAAYRLVWKRRRLLWRSVRSRHRLSLRQDRTGNIRPGDILAVLVVHNEIARLPHFLDHYRGLGVGQFLVVDNASTDGTADLLMAQPDVSLWSTPSSYRAARFGLDWASWLLIRYGHKHWCLTLDADELLVYAGHDSHDLHSLTTLLDSLGHDAFGALMLDLYPQGPIGTPVETPTQDPLAQLGWFDAGPYRVQRQAPMENLWVQGGVRERVFFADNTRRSPTLNKVPLVRWNRRFAYVNSTHSMLPRRLNHAYDGPGGSLPSGVLLHTKFLPGIVTRTTQERARAEHFHDPALFQGYYDDIERCPVLWHSGSVRLDGWQSLVDKGLMSPLPW